MNTKDQQSDENMVMISASPLEQQQQHQQQQQTDENEIKLMNKQVRNNNLIQQRRMKLFLLVRILLQYLDKVHPPTSSLAKAIMKDCERKHTTNNSKYATLECAIHDRLRDAVGEGHWAAVKKIQKVMILKQRRRTMVMRVLKEQKQGGNDV